MHQMTIRSPATCLSSVAARGHRAPVTAYTPGVTGCTHSSLSGMLSSDDLLHDTTYDC